MEIEISGRNVQLTDELRRHVHSRFERIGRQVSELARLEVELREQRNPSVSDRQVAEATLHLKGVTLRARESSPEMRRAIKAVAHDIGRQVKRHRERRRKRSQTRRLVNRLRRRAA